MAKPKTKTAPKTGSDQRLRKRPPVRTSWKAGQSGNPKGRPRSGESLAEVVRTETSQIAIVKRMQWLADHAESETVRYHALSWLSERGYGKAPQEVILHQGNEYAKRVRGKDLTITQLEALAALDEPVDIDESPETDGGSSSGLN